MDRHLFRFLQIFLVIVAAGVDKIANYLNKSNL
jgi:hypothetical protein